MTLLFLIKSGRYLIFLVTVFFFDLVYSAQVSDSISFPTNYRDTVLFKNVYFYLTGPTITPPSYSFYLTNCRPFYTCPDSINCLVFKDSLINGNFDSIFNSITSVPADTQWDSLVEYWMESSLQPDSINIVSPLVRLVFLKNIGSCDTIYGKILLTGKYKCDYICIMDACDYFSSPDSVKLKWVWNTENSFEPISSIKITYPKESINALFLCPNPFIPGSAITFHFTQTIQGSGMRIMIYNSLGQIRKSFVVPGGHDGQRIFWDGCDNAGKMVESGVYFVSGTAGLEKIKPVRLVISK